MSDVTIPSSATPALTKLVFAVLRAILAALGAAGVALPASLTDQGTLYQIAGAIALVVALILQVVAEYRNQSLNHRTAVASAQAGRPVRPLK